MSGNWNGVAPEEVLKYAADVLHETEENRRNGVTEILKWSSENPHLHIRTEEKYILPFLRGSEFNVEKTKEKLINYYTMRRDRTEWFLNRNPNLPDLQDLIKSGCSLVLKKKHQNQLVVIFRLVYDTKLHNLDEFFKICLMILDIAMMEEEIAQIYGVIAIVDIKNINLAHAKQLSVERIKHMVHAWENYHCIPQQINFINAPKFVNVMLNLFMKFMSENLKKRIHIRYDGISSLYNDIDKSILPKEYGGVEESLNELGEYWLNKLMKYTDWFSEDEKFKAE